MNPAIIIVNYNSYDETIRCIENLKSIGMDCYSIIVVDNNSSNDSYNILDEYFKNTEITILNAEHNRGYAAGNNIGIKYALENGNDYFCIMNNDLVIHEDFLGICVNYLENNRNVAFVGPAIIDFNNKYIQSTGGEIDFLRGLTPLKNFGEKCESINDKEIDCDFISGACIVTSKDNLNEVGFIPEKYFAYYEETEWCYKAKKLGRKCICLSSISIEHKGAVTMEKARKINLYLSERNKLVFIRDNSNAYIYIRFLIYLIVHTIYMSVKDKKSYLRYYTYYIDGILNRFSKEYKDIINN